MSGRSWPLRFPIVDVATGARSEPAEVANTIERGAGPVLEVKNLTTRFDVLGGVLGRKVGAVHAVENVSFDLAAAYIHFDDSRLNSSTAAFVGTPLVTPSMVSGQVSGAGAVFSAGVRYAF